MEFILSLAVVAGLLSAALVAGIFRSNQPSGKVIAIFVGLILFVLFAWGGLWLVMYQSARRGHPF